MNATTAAHTTRTDHGHITITIDGITWQPDDYSANTWYPQVLGYGDISAVVQLEYNHGWYYSVRDYSHSTAAIVDTADCIVNLFDALRRATVAILPIAAQHTEAYLASLETVPEGN